ncbi:hypothetical protein niasHS_010715 [Heterodera schachtii]|uniref:C-type lectin domain-containing protein n=1 Tax=Heterodera schachtii TaxID=97005 RepID=A0ABD2J331_HETSC
MPWAPGQPSGTVDWTPRSAPTECVQMLLANQQLFGTQAEDGQWNDFECGREVCGVICKKKAKSKGQSEKP